MSIQRWLRGECYHFALAVADLIPDAEFVAIGEPHFSDHVAIRVGDQYIDARGILDAETFVPPHLKGRPVVTAKREDVELQAGLSGVKPPYRGVPEMRDARNAVKRVFPDGFTLIDMSNANQPKAP